MSFYVEHRMGGSDEPRLDELPALLAELDEDPDDQEHVSVSVVHENDWGVSAYPSGRVVYENVEDLEREPRHMFVDRGTALRLLELAALGRTDELEREPWLPGYGPDTQA